MRKDGKQQYIVKKEKLQKIKKYLEALYCLKTAKSLTKEDWKGILFETIENLWEIVKDEK